MMMTMNEQAQLTRAAANLALSTLRCWNSPSPSRRPSPAQRRALTKMPMNRVRSDFRCPATSTNHASLHAGADQSMAPTFLCAPIRLHASLS